MNIKKVITSSFTIPADAEWERVDNADGSITVNCKRTIYVTETEKKREVSAFEEYWKGYQKLWTKYTTEERDLAWDAWDAALHHAAEVAENYDKRMPYMANMVTAGKQIASALRQEVDE